MLKFWSSIRQKITLGYYAIVVVIVGLAVFTFVELRLLENRIIFGEAIAEFFDTTLEIRRFEKNYFLYAQDADYRENIAYVVRAQEILAANIHGFSMIASAGRVTALKENLGRYRELMERYNLNRPKMSIRPVLAETIRKTGKDIVTVAEDISRMERKNLQSILSRYQRMLIVWIISLSSLAVVIGQVLSRMVVRPLQKLEESMGVIAEGKFERVAIDSRDREIVSLTRAFNKMLKQLELHERHLIQSEKLASLGTLLSGVAHELNNPLSNISSSAQILAEEIDDGDREHRKELVAQINEQSDRARNIVRSLLDFSRDREFRKERLPLRRLIDETIQFLRGQVPTNVTITLSVPDDLVIIADKQRIQQVFLNLIKNAVEAVPGSGGTVDITARKRRAREKTEEDAMGIYNYLKFRGKCTVEDDTVDIEIHDTGAGIPSELLPKIFDPFFTTKDVGKGSGLGLFIVHDIIEEHDGCVAVDSGPEKGTTFYIKLPFKEST
jgi:signal transduction histidine kinase